MAGPEFDGQMGRFRMITRRHQSLLRRFAYLAIGFVVLVNANTLRAQEGLAGGADFNALLRARTRIAPVGDGTPPTVRNHVDDFRRSIGIAIFLDRRVDPDASLALDIPELRVEFAMREFAMRQKMGVVVRAGYLYVGPGSLCKLWPGELDELAKRVAKLRPNDKSFWETKSFVRWEEGSSPRELAEKIAGDKLSKPEAARISHDIWAGFDGPELPRWEQLALVCAGFGLVPDFNAQGELTLRPIGEGKTQTASIALPAAAISEAIENIGRYFPDVKTTSKQSKVEIEGSVGDVKAIQSWFAAPAPKRSTAPRAAGPTILLSTPVAVPARQLLIKLAQDAKLELTVAADVAPEAVNKKIQPSWKGTRAELLKKISDEIGLVCELEEGKIVVRNP